MLRLIAATFRSREPRTPKARSALLPVVGGITAFGLGGLISQGVYEWLVVPRLPEPGSAPLHSWLASMLPLASAVVLLAAAARTYLELSLAAVAGGLARHTLETVFASLGRPGHVKSSALEAPPLLWWSRDLLWSVTVVAVSLLVVRIFLLGVRRLMQGSWNET